MSAFVRVIIVLLIAFVVVQLTAKLFSRAHFEQSVEQAGEDYASAANTQRLQSAQRVAELEVKRAQLIEYDRIGRSPSIHRIKHKVEQYYRAHQRWPADMSDIGMHSTDAAEADMIDSIKIDDGEIYAFLAPRFGVNKIVRMFHGKSHHPYQRRWQCTTNLAIGNKGRIHTMPCSEDVNIAFHGRHFQ